MRGVNRVLAMDADAGTVVAEAGLSLDSLMRQIVPFGWFVPVTPGTRFVTLGGALACDIHGKNHHRDGTFGAHVEWADLVTPEGSIRRIDRRNDAALFDATTGGMGLTGIVMAVRLRLVPISGPFLSVTTQRFGNFDALIHGMLERDDEHKYAVAWVDCLSRGRAFGRGIGLWGDHTSLAPGQSKPYAPRALGRVPDIVPSGMLRATSARIFNAVWFRRAPARLTTRIESLASFFHPLDGVADWNRVYGSRGFVQYQFVVPHERIDALREVLARLAASETSSFLAVLKRFGAAGSGHLSFPIPGWTLAVDIPVGQPRLARFLDDLDALVCDAGGRIYLAKDARAHPEQLERMYPRLSEWRAVVKGVDPEHIMRSDLDRRLGLR